MWKTIAKPRLISITMAMSTLQLPAYVLLEIVDRLVVFPSYPAYLKIRVIVNVLKSCEKIIDRKLIEKEEREKK
jgi:hypothetical protein